MSLSDCPSCWETPCVCSSEYRRRNYTLEKSAELIASILRYRSVDEREEILRLSTLALGSFDKELYL